MTGAGNQLVAPVVNTSPIYDLRRETVWVCFRPRAKNHEPICLDHCLIVKVIVTPQDPEQRGRLNPMTPMSAITRDVGTC